MLTISIVLSSIPTAGGKFTYSYTILSALSQFDQKNFYISVVTLEPEWHPLLAAFNFPNVKTINLSLYSKLIRKLFLSLPFGLKLWRQINCWLDPLQIYLHKIKPDYIIFPNSDLFSLETKFRVIAPIHDLMHLYETSFPEVSDSFVYNSREKYFTQLCKFGSIILVDSLLGKTHVLESYNINPEKICVLPLIASPIFTSTNQTIDVLEKYNISSPYLFYPAQFWEHKNHAGVIEAVKLLKEENILIHVVFAGSEKNNYKFIKDKINKLGLEHQITILGFITNEEIVSLYQSAFIFIMPTFFGPTNAPPLEAFRFGCPVITSNIYAIPNQLGDAAIYCDPSNYEDIANKIKLLIYDSELRQNLISKGYAFDRNWNLIKYSKCLEEIIINNFKEYYI